MRCGKAGGALEVSNRARSTRRDRRGSGVRGSSHLKDSAPPVTHTKWHILDRMWLVSYDG